MHIYALAGVSALASGLCIFNMNQSGASLGPDFNLAAKAGDALAHSPPDLDRALTMSETALAQAPMDAGAWMQVAYVRWLKTGHLDSESLHALEMSYLAAPLGPDVTRWRLRFMFENWTALNPRLRALTLAELDNFAHFHKGAVTIVDRLESPAGRLAASLALRQIYMKIGKKAQGTRSSASLLNDYPKSEPPNQP